MGCASVQMRKATTSRTQGVDADPVIKTIVLQISAATIDRVLVAARLHIDAQRKRRNGMGSAIRSSSDTELMKEPKRCLAAPELKGIIVSSEPVIRSAARRRPTRMRVMSTSFEAGWVDPEAPSVH